MSRIGARGRCSRLVVSVQAQPEASGLLFQHGCNLPQLDDGTDRWAIVEDRGEAHFWARRLHVLIRAQGCCAEEKGAGNTALFDAIRADEGADDLVRWVS